MTKFGIDSAAAVDLSVVVPAYNETLRLPPMLTASIEHLSTIRSHRSGLWEEVPKADIRVVTFDKNRQKGGAVKHGVLHSRGRRILMVDADGASQFRDLELLWKQLDAVQSGEEGVAVGSRAHLVKTEAVVKRSFIRNLLMYGFHFLLRTVGVGYIYDTQCGFKNASCSADPTLLSS
ncbi:dolichyl-phosphate beta-glucosyltransferase [Tulasnella sp. UAMH 9824]|nr:dolichyl-phosphate beta-glucosyltransferase [Tulasnella sp. UAMH 9824]